MMREMYFDIYKSKKALSQPYWWVAKGQNHETLCTSEMLSSKRACANAIDAIRGGARFASVYDETGETAGDAAARRIA